MRNNLQRWKAPDHFPIQLTTINITARKFSMNKKPDTTTIVAAAAVTIAAGVASYFLYKTYNTLKKLEELDLDFGNDVGLLSMFNRKDDK